MTPHWGDDTKVRKLSGPRSCGDARGFSNLSWNTIFKVPRRWRRWQCTEKLRFAIEIRQSSACFSPWNHDQMPLRGVFQPLNRRKFTLNALNCPLHRIFEVAAVAKGEGRDRAPHPFLRDYGKRRGESEKKPLVKLAKRSTRGPGQRHQEERSGRSVRRF